MGLYERYLEDVYRYVWQRVPSVTKAEDITAEVFAAAVAGLSRFRGECPPNLFLHREPRSAVRGKEAPRREAAPCDCRATSLTLDASNAK
jgi:hypothetical protein